MLVLFATNKGITMFENWKIPENLTPDDPRFGCGPSLISPDIVYRLANDARLLLGTSHRKPAVKNMVKEIQEGLSTYFNIPSDYRVVLGNGGATFLFDMIGLGLVNKKSVHFTCGEFSNKWFKSHKNIPWIEAEEVSVDYGHGINSENRSDSDVVCCTLNETSTGVIFNELPRVDDKTLLCVDATSGAGQVECDVSKTDMFFFSPQKVFASDGGLFVAIMSPKALKRATEIHANKDRYFPVIMDWKLAIDNSEKNQTYNTPALATLYFLNEQVKAMNELGLAKVTEMADAKANHIYSWANEKDYLNCYVSEEKFRSNAVATIDVDVRFDVAAIIKIFERENLALGIDSYRKLGRNQFRIALFHNIKIEDLKKLTSLISSVIESEL
jgi:phosphoserine aminotransferase